MTNSLRQRSSEVMKKLNDGLNIGIFDLAVLLCDNIGFKVIGKRATYDQWTALVPRVITEKELRGAGFYSDDPSKRLSRDPACNWEDAIASVKGDKDEINKLIDSIVGIAEEDYISMDESVLEDIRIALEYAGLLRHNNSNIVGTAIPRLERICDEGTCGKWKQALGDAKRSPDRLASQPFVIPRDNASGDMGLQPETKSKYELNNASLEAVHEDLAKNTTQTELMNSKVLELVVEHSCASIPGEDAEKLEATQLRNKEYSSGSSASAPYSLVTEDFINVCTKFSAIDLWAPDKAPIIGKSSNAPIYATTDALEVPGRQGGSLHASILDCMTSLGDLRVREYFNLNYTQYDNRVERTEKEEDGGVCLSKMSTTVKRLEDEKRTRLRATAKKKTIKDYMKIAGRGEVGEVEDVRNES